MTAASTPRPPAVTYLPAPGHRHPPRARLGGDIAQELDQLHDRCVVAVDEPLDAGEALLEVTSRHRLRYVTGGGSSIMLGSDLVDAIVHAARAGYRLCLKNVRPVDVGHWCWLPRGHDGDCEHRGWWRWTLLYGYAGPVREYCTGCHPEHPRPQAPPDCPHRRLHPFPTT